MSDFQFNFVIQCEKVLLIHFSKLGSFSIVPIAVTFSSTWLLSTVTTL